MMKRMRYQRPPRVVPGTTEDIMSFLAAHGTRDKDSALPREEKAVLRRTEKRKGGVLRMTLDLHGLTSEEAYGRLRLAIEECGSRGVKELLVIHGKGIHSGPDEGPVLKSLVLRSLENELDPHVRYFRGGLPKEGGEGATLVLLK
jgi:DNA-nicking Smr family endonuclease